VISENVMTRIAGIAEMTWVTSVCFDLYQESKKRTGHTARCYAKQSDLWVRMFRRFCLSVGVGGARMRTLFFAPIICLLVCETPLRITVFHACAGSQKHAHFASLICIKL